VITLRLPSGRLVRSLKGGQWVLRDLLIELEEEKFNGFVRTNLRKGMKYGEGAIVLKDGVPVLASYSYEDEISGPECLGHLVEDDVGSVRRHHPEVGAGRFETVEGLDDFFRSAIPLSGL